MRDWENDKMARAISGFGFPTLSENELEDLENLAWQSCNKAVGENILSLIHEVRKYREGMPS